MGWSMVVFSVEAKAFASVIAEPLRLRELLEHEPGSAAARGFPRGACELEKTSEGIHFVLTGDAGDTAEPLGFLEYGGATVGNGSLGLGAARAISPEQVKRIDAALRPITSEEFQRRLDPRALLASWPYHDESWDEASTRRYFGEAYAQLHQLVGEAAAAGDGLVLITI